MKQTNFAMAAAMRTGNGKPLINDLTGGLELLGIYYNSRIELGLPINKAAQEIMEVIGYLRRHDARLRAHVLRYRAKANNHDNDKEKEGIYREFESVLSSLLQVEAGI
ncbi:hypothetical protein L3V43_23205 [Pseudoalteromonas sp. L23]|uniref:hypothetical protein n=1 Tax=unclassified Pseudoalteromonas TaxID=194690 RepID=UPI001EEFEA4B|nr:MULTISPECIES: hypothetical protein [unclassified Pseudoalteromonas]MCF7516483.1 hypothetical protein [Pseudoalteromonas sp. L7]MCF7528544.1 hypothetical protein [Pseudoalteromonas sp. L23]MCX2767882.1 hypothetical protein [Pseudoalteromonas sp. B530]